MNEEKIKDNIYMGYYDTLRVLKNYDGYKYTFYKKSDRYYCFITRKIAEKNFQRVKNFFHTTTKRATVLKALEYVMEKEKIYYYQVYRVPKVIRCLKKDAKKQHFIYDFVRSLKFL